MALTKQQPQCFPDSRSRQDFPGSPSGGAKKEVPLLPLRLFDVGDQQRSNSIRLRISRSDERGCYCALSYRWGSKVPLRTTMRTLESHKRSIKDRHLPQTFRDAMRVTRCLGLRYLWIDALCIVQDDKNDWLRQAALMGSIYENCSATIAVHSAEDCAEGFPWRREVSDFLEIRPADEREIF